MASADAVQGVNGDEMKESLSQGTSSNAPASLNNETAAQQPNSTPQDDELAGQVPGSENASRLSQDQEAMNKSDEQTDNRDLVWMGDPQASSGDRKSKREARETKEKDPNSDQGGSRSGAPSRRVGNGAIGSVYSGNKIQHLKKDDGIPLWRKDIQLEFLRYVFEDDTKCFTMSSDGTKGHSFADTYIDCMAKSSKTSKVLRDKLFSDHQSAVNMAMICLLVNIGRMNTTLNFFPEMRAQLRTFHAIPSLQIGQDANAYKQLQDAPRLKSILKGASEDKEQPSSIEKIKSLPITRTNPVHLIFILSQFAPKVSEMHFQPPRDFFDLVMRPTLSSKSRARAFLWLMWWYLESGFSDDEALHNPFGPGEPGDGTDGRPLKVPSFEHLTEEQANAENIDTEAEMQYGEQKRLERRRILDEEETMGPPPKRQRRGVDDSHLSTLDSDPPRSLSPSPINMRKGSVDQARKAGPAHSPSKENGTGNSRYPAIASKLGAEGSRSRSSFRRSLKARAVDPTGSSPPGPTGSTHQGMGGHSGSSRRSRPETSHQRAVNLNRRKRVDHIVHKQLATRQALRRREKRQMRSSFGMLVINRVKDLPDTYDSEDEKAWGPGGMVPGEDELEDFGEEGVRHRKVLERAVRRLTRAESGEPLDRLVPNSWANHPVGFTNEREPQPRSSGRRAPTQRTKRRIQPSARRRSQREHTPSVNGDQLDELDLDLLGEGRGDDTEDTDDYD